MTPVSTDGGLFLLLVKWHVQGQAYVFYSSNYGDISLYSSEYSVNKAMVFVACEYSGVWKTKVFHCSHFCGIYKAIISSESIADVQAKVFDSAEKQSQNKFVFDNS